MANRFGDSDLQEAPAVNRFGDSATVAPVNRFGDSVVSSGQDRGSSEISTPPDYNPDGTRFEVAQPAQAPYDPNAIADHNREVVRNFGSVLGQSAVRGTGQAVTGTYRLLDQIVGGLGQRAGIATAKALGIITPEQAAEAQARSDSGERFTALPQAIQSGAKLAEISGNNIESLANQYNPNPAMAGDTSTKIAGALGGLAPVLVSPGTAAPVLAGYFGEGTREQAIAEGDNPALADAKFNLGATGGAALSLVPGGRAAAGTLERIGTKIIGGAALGAGQDLALQKAINPDKALDTDSLKFNAIFGGLFGAAHAIPDLAGAGVRLPAADATLQQRAIEKTPEQISDMLAQEIKTVADPARKVELTDWKDRIDNLISARDERNASAEAAQKIAEQQQKALEQQQKAQADAQKQAADAQAAANEIPKSTQILQETNKPPVLANVATEAGTQTSPYALQGKLNEITAAPSPPPEAMLPQIAPSPSALPEIGAAPVSDAQANFERRKALFDARRSAEKAAIASTPEVPEISRAPAGAGTLEPTPRQLAARMRQDRAGVAGAKFKAPMAEADPATAAPFPTAQESKFADIKKAVANPDTQFQYTVQQGEQGYPGYVQVDAIVGSPIDHPIVGQKVVKDGGLTGGIPDSRKTSTVTGVTRGEDTRGGSQTVTVHLSDGTSYTRNGGLQRDGSVIPLDEAVRNALNAGGAEVVPPSDAPPPVNRFGDANPTSIKNATVATERAARNIRPAEEAAKRAFGTAWDEAGAKIASDSQAAVKLADELRNKPRALTDTEDALLLHRQIELQGQFDDVAKRINESPTTPDPSDQIAFQQLSDQLLDLYDINKKTGTETGRGLNARKLLANEDFSLAKMTTAKRAANGGRALTPKETADVQSLHDKIASTQKAFDDYVTKTDARLSQVEADNAILRIIKEAKPGAKKASPAVASKFISDRAAEAKARIAARLEKAFTAQAVEGDGKSGLLSKENLTDFSIVGADYISKGLEKVGDFAKQIITDFGERVRPFVDQIFEASKRAHETLAARAGEGTKTAIEQIRAKVTEGAPLSDMTYYVQKLARELVESGITDRNKLVDAVHESLKEIKPDITRRQTQDAISGYGVFKQLTKDQVSVQLRDLKGQLQQVSKLEDMNAGKAPAKTGIERRIPTQVESELIKQVNAEKAKGGYNVTDPATQLKSQLQSAETRANNTIAELERQLRTNELFTAEKRTPQTNAIIEAKKAQIEILKQEREYARHHLQPGAEPPTGIETRVKQLDAQVAKVEAQLKSGEIFSPETKHAPITSPEIAAREETFKQLKQEREYLRDSIQPKPEPLNSEQRALAAVKKNLIKRTAELQDKLARGDFSTKPRRAVDLDPEAQALKADNARAKQAYQLGLQKDQLANRPTWVKGLNLVSKWFRAAALSSPVTFAKLALATLQQGIVHPLDEMAGSIYSKVLPALDEKAPVQGGGFSAKMSAKALSDGIIKGWGDLKDTLSKSKGYKSDLDAIYGKNGLPPEALEFFGLLHGAEKAPLKRAAFSYAMEKQTAYALRNGLDVTDPGVQTRMGLEAYKYANRSIFQEQNWVSDMYSRALSRLSEKNKITGRPSVLLTGAEAALRSALPVTKVGTNIVFQAFERAFGTAQGGFELARAYRDGFDKMKPEEADIILRHLKRGSVGAAILAAGFFMPEIFGGFYRKGEKRDPKDVAVGEIKSPIELPKFVSRTGNIPAYGLHGPAIEVAQLGSTLRRVADSKLRKRDTETQGLTNGALAAGLGLVAETPFVKETLDQAKMFEPGGAPNVIGNFAQGAIPQIVQFAARHMDQDAEGNTIKRKPDGILQQIEMGIPTLRNTLPQSGAPLSDKPISRMLEIAQDFKAKNGEIAPDPERYKNLRYALEQKNDAEATKQINALLEKTDANKLLNGFRESLMAPFTGSKVNDYKLSQILTPEDAATLQQAKALQLDALRRFGGLLQKAAEEKRLAQSKKN